MNREQFDREWQGGRRDFHGEYLAGANLAGAYLAHANLAGANLAGANLADAYLAGANLAGANLAGAYLAGAYLAGANLAGANLAGAYLAGANLAGANLAGADGITEAVIHQLRENVGLEPTDCIAPAVLEQIEKHPNSWDQSVFHSTCGTKHCIAGWAVALHPHGKVLEKTLGIETAATILLAVPGKPLPSFSGYADDDETIERLRAMVRGEDATP